MNIIALTEAANEQTVANGRKMAGVGADISVSKGLLTGQNCKSRIGFTGCRTAGTRRTSQARLMYQKGLAALERSPLKRWPDHVRLPQAALALAFASEHRVREARQVLESLVPEAERQRPKLAPPKSSSLA